MRAVWSFWTKPAHHAAVWSDTRYHLLAWILSVMKGREQFGTAALVTDTRGRAVLSDGLGLPFDAVSTALDELPEARRDAYVLGKLRAYQMQTEPFIHIDSDVFLWRPLPAGITGMPLFAQNPETFTPGESATYRPDDLDRALDVTGGWRPAAWRWAIANRLGQAANCGIVGANDVAFMSRFAADAARFITDEANQPAWQLLGTLRDDNTTLEQFMLAAAVAYERQRPGGDERLNVYYLFESMDAAFTPARAEALGYTHLLGGAKHNRELLARLERRVARDYPQQYRACLRLLEVWKGW